MLGKPPSMFYSEFTDEKTGIHVFVFSPRSPDESQGFLVQYYRQSKLLNEQLVLMQDSNFMLNYDSLEHLQSQVDERIKELNEKKQ